MSQEAASLKSPNTAGAFVKGRLLELSLRPRHPRTQAGAYSLRGTQRPRLDPSAAPGEEKAVQAQAAVVVLRLARVSSQLVVGAGPCQAHLPRLERGRTTGPRHQQRAIIRRPSRARPSRPRVWCASDVCSWSSAGAGRRREVVPAFVYRPPDSHPKSQSAPANPTSLQVPQAKQSPSLFAL